jgi:hypothetical protein
MPGVNLTGNSAPGTRGNHHQIDRRGDLQRTGSRVLPDGGDGILKRGNSRLALGESRSRLVGTLHGFFREDAPLARAVFVGRVKPAGRNTLTRSVING